MGSILSFVVLCIINAAACRRAYELGELREQSLKKIPLLINGDDALMKCDDNVRKYWESCARVCGLKPSVGKVQFHPNYFNINSQSYWDDLSGRSPLHIPYVNMGLLMGLKRSGKGQVTQVVADSKDPYSSTLGARHRELIRYAPECLRVKTHEAFLKLNRNVLKRSKVPWYLPEDVGGIGLAPIGKWEFECDPEDGMPINKTFKYHKKEDGSFYGPSELDRKIYRLLVNGMVQADFVTDQSDDPIDVRKIAQHAMPRLQCRYVLQNQISEPTHESVRKARGICDLLAVYLFPEDVCCTSTETSGSTRAVEENELHWARITRESYGFNIKPFDYIEPCSKVEVGRVLISSA